MKIIYFSWLREKTGVGEEEISLPSGVGDVAGFVEWLKGRGGGFVEAFGDMSMVRVAVNQEHVETDHPLSADDEVAFFPPVSGG